MTDSREVTVRLVDAFTDEPLTGNAAGVVPDAAGLSESQMGAIARELAVSETAFLRPSDRADRRIRYFTPEREVDLCGHATIGSFAHLHETGALGGEADESDQPTGDETGASGADSAPGDGEETRDGPVRTTLETNVGTLEIEVEPDGTVWMTQDAPTIREVEVGYGRVADALGIDREALRGASADLPLAVASTGLPFLMVPVTYLSDLGDADPDVGAIEALSADLDAAGIYAFTFDALAAESTLHGRAFAPAVGVPEDPVTGTASGAAGTYLERFEAFGGESPDAGSNVADDGAGPAELRFEQGHFLDRPGTVRVRVGREVRVGGRGVTALEGTVVVPPDDDEEIIEA